MKVILASDHAGFKLKEVLKRFLESKGYAAEDIGPFKLDKNDDYPDYILPAARAVAKANSKDTKGIVIGWSGQGEAIAANKVKGIRAVVYYGKQPKIIALSKEHNDSNVLSLGAGFIKPAEAKKAASKWLNTDFTNEVRHKRRLKKLSLYETKKR